MGVGTSPVEIFSIWSRMIEADRGAFAGLGQRYLWTVTGPDGGVWIMSIAAQRPLQQLPAESTGGSIQCRIQCDGETLNAIASGDLNPQAALASGKLSLSGPTNELIELNFILDKLIPANIFSNSSVLQ